MNLRMSHRHQLWFWFGEVSPGWFLHADVLENHWTIPLLYHWGLGPNIQPILKCSHLPTSHLSTPFSCCCVSCFLLLYLCQGRVFTGYIAASLVPRWEMTMQSEDAYLKIVDSINGCCMWLSIWRVCGVCLIHVFAYSAFLVHKSCIIVDWENRSMENCNFLINNAFQFKYVHRDVRSNFISCFM